MSHLRFKNTTKTIKHLDKVKKKTLKMWKIVATLPSDLKNIYDYDPYKKNMLR